MGSEPQELLRVQGEAGGELSDDGIQCRLCHNRGHTVHSEHRGDGEGRLPRGDDVCAEPCRAPTFPEGGGTLGARQCSQRQLSDHLSCPPPCPSFRSNVKSAADIRAAPNVPTHTCPSSFFPVSEETSRLRHPYPRASSLWLGKELLSPHRPLAKGLPRGPRSFLGLGRGYKSIHRAQEEIE